MPRDAKVLEILIASPSDVPDERDLIEGVVHDWNRMHSRATSLILIPIRWESDVFPEMGDRPQEIVNRQIVDRADILVGVFWTRLGTPTGAAASGTVEEVDRFLSAGKPVMLYFSDKPVAPDSINPDELQRVRTFRDDVRSRGLAFTYTSLVDLRDQLTRHLAQRIYDLAPVLQASTGALTPTRRPRNDGKALRDELLRRMAGIQAEWLAERDAYTEAGGKPYDHAEKDSSRDLLAQIGQLLTTAISSPVLQTDEAMTTRLRSLLAKSKEISKIQLFMDGGRSWRALWQGGEQLIEETIRTFGDIQDSIS